MGKKFEPEKKLSVSGPLWTDTAISETVWATGGMIRPAVMPATAAAAAAVEAETPGIGALQKILEEERRNLDGDDAELVRLREQTRRVQERKKETVERVEMLEKELELLEAYARIREAGDG
jgi:hypothetical protein